MVIRISHLWGIALLTILVDVIMLGFGTSTPERVASGIVSVLIFCILCTFWSSREKP